MMTKLEFGSAFTLAPVYVPHSTILAVFLLILYIMIPIDI
jgi:hypothetical protein